MHRRADVRRHDRAAGTAHYRLPARRDHGHAQLHAVDPGWIPEPRYRPARLLVAVRHLRRRTLDQRDAPGDRTGVRHGRHRYLWTLQMWSPSLVSTHSCDTPGPITSESP